MPGTIKTMWVVLQLGGSSGECYGSGYLTEKTAKHAVEKHRQASYDASCLKVEMREPVTSCQVADIADAMAKAAVEFARQHVAE